AGRRTPTALKRRKANGSLPPIKRNTRCWTSAKSCSSTPLTPRPSRQRTISGPTPRCERPQEISGMADLSDRQRLQPSLLDRLTDDSRATPRESRDARVLSIEARKRNVLRHLGWLLNTEYLASRVDLSKYPHVASSVL